MKMSDTIAEIAQALAKAQGQIDDATKDATNPHYKSKYADLAAVRAVIREPLSVNDIAYVQASTCNGDEVSVETMLIHKSGEFISESLSIPLGKRDAHGIGSAISYGRRYGLMSLLGLAADDDDGNAAVQGAPDAAPKRKAAPPPPVNPQLPSEAEIMALMQIGDDKTREGLVALQTWWKGLTGAERYALGDKQKDEWKLMAERLEQGMAA